MVDKMATPGAVANAYANTLKSATQGASEKASAAVGDSSFASLIDNMADQLVNSQNRAEKVSADAVVGEANITDVVMAMNDAEITLQTVISVRDKLISSYQRIMQMPI